MKYVFFGVCYFCSCVQCALKSHVSPQCGDGIEFEIKRDQEPINRSLHIHCILESTFARIFLFLELPFLQEAQFYRENLSQSSSVEDSSDLPAITVTFRRDHFM